MTQLQRVWDTGNKPKASWKNKSETWHTESKSINLRQSTSGFDSTVLNPVVKDSMQQSSKYFHCSSVSVRDNCDGDGGKIPRQYLSCVPFPPDSHFFLMYSCYCQECREMDGWKSPVGDLYRLHAQCSRSHISPVSNLKQRQ